MSEQYTPEPWGIERTTKRLWIGPLRDNGKIDEIVCSVDFDEHYTDKAKERIHANARRIVACVNALEGVSTTDLEQYGDAFADGYISVAEREKLQARVKELEAALDAVARVAMGARKPTVRTKWIAQRAISALNSDEKWTELKMPHNSPILAKIEAEKNKNG